MPDIVGIIRFSFVSSDAGQFKASRARSNDDVAATILSDDRLATRFRLFEKYTLPSLKAQSDPDFSIVLLASSLLPSHRRERLEALIADVPQISARYGEPQKPGGFIRASLPSVASDQWRVTFRLDDDDALSTDFVATLREIAHPAYQGMCVSMPKVVHVEEYEDKALFYPSWTAKHSAGLSYIGRPGEARSIYHVGGHSRVDQHALTIIDSRRFSALRLFHSFNDHPYPTTTKRKRPLTRQQFEERIGDGFPYLFG